MQFFLKDRLMFSIESFLWGRIDALYLPERSSFTFPICFVWNYKKYYILFSSCMELYTCCYLVII
jgi:hypothetical protein